jgi:hypothetical protein
LIGGAVLGMEACWPSGVVVRGRAPNRPVLCWLRTVVVSDGEKARLIASGGDAGRRSRKRPARGELAGVRC